MSDTVTSADRPLAEYLVMIPMVRQMPTGKVCRRFVVQIPAVDPESAISGAHQIAIGINEATGCQWKIGKKLTAMPLLAEDDADDEPERLFRADAAVTVVAR